MGDHWGGMTADLHFPFYLVSQGLISKWLCMSPSNVESLRRYIIMSLKIIDL